MKTCYGPRSDETSPKQRLLQRITHVSVRVTLLEPAIWAVPPDTGRFSGYSLRPRHDLRYLEGTAQVGLTPPLDTQTLTVHRCYSELLRIADDMDDARRRPEYQAAYITFFGAVLALEGRAWNAVLDAFETGLLTGIPGLPELIAFDAGTGSRPRFVPEAPWSWDGGYLQPFRILCGQGVEFYERGPLDPRDIEPVTMESGDRMEPLKCGPLVPSNILLPGLFPREFVSSSAHTLSSTQPEQLGYAGKVLEAEKSEALRDRCERGATACRLLADLTQSTTEWSSRLQPTSPELATALRSARMLIDGATESLSSSLRTYDEQYGSSTTEFKEKRANAVGWAWSKYRLAYAQAISAARHVPGSPALPPERLSREGVSVVTDIFAAFTELRDWLEDVSTIASRTSSTPPATNSITATDSTSGKFNPSALAPELNAVPKEPERVAGELDRQLTRLEHLIIERGDDYLSIAEFAEYIRPAGGQEQLLVGLRTRLGRWRANSQEHDGWHERDRGRREARYLYKPTAVRNEIEALLKRIVK